MIDYNNKKQINEIRKIKNNPNWKEYRLYIESKLIELKDLQTIENVIQLNGRKEAIKIIEDILLFIN